MTHPDLARGNYLTKRDWLLGGAKHYAAKAEALALEGKQVESDLFRSWSKTCLEEAETLK